MKRIGQISGWCINRISKFFGNIPSFFIRMFVPVRKGTVMCWSYDFKQYSCNPRYLTEYILDNNPEFTVYWIFRKNVQISGLDSRTRCVRFKSWEYFMIANTAEFLITNCRTDAYRYYWRKRPDQKYMMLWHGGVALKKIEKDAEQHLGFTYLTKARRDSKMCDLMISGCKAQTRLLKEKFWYKGEILESGIPRSDIFFATDSHKEMKERICKEYEISTGSRLILYAPTFRRNRSLEPYRIDWSRTITRLRDFYGTENVKILLRLHPNMLNKVDISPLLNDPSVVDVTRYHDMQELLCISEMLITDYSSSMFDFSMLDKPCILYATDIREYDRGYYFNFEELPYPLAKSQEELESIIKDFDMEGYRHDVKEFLDNKVGLFEDGKACRRIAEWMKSKAL